MYYAKLGGHSGGPTDSPCPRWHLYSLLHSLHQHLYVCAYDLGSIFNISLCSITPPTASSLCLFCTPIHPPLKSNYKTALLARRFKDITLWILFFKSCQYQGYSIEKPCCLKSYQELQGQHKNKPALIKDRANAESVKATLPWSMSLSVSLSPLLSEFIWTTGAPPVMYINSVQALLGETVFLNTELPFLTSLIN